jgi:hypothetical protein
MAAPPFLENFHRFQLQVATRANGASRRIETGRKGAGRDDDAGYINDVGAF